MQSEQSDEPSTEQFEEVDHPGKATALLACASPEEIFLSGTDGSENVSRLADHGRRRSVRLGKRLASTIESLYQFSLLDRLQSKPRSEVAPDCIESFANRCAHGALTQRPRECRDEASTRDDGTVV